MSTAVLVVDLIQEFVTGRLGNPRAQAVVPRVKTLLDAARRKGYRIIHVTDAHIPGVDAEFEVWGSHAEAGTPGAEIVPELAPQKGDFHLHKRRYSAFYATGLDELLRELNVKKLIVAGVLTNICIQHTAADAYFRGYKVTVPRDLVDALTDEEQEDSLAFMKRMYGAEATDSKTLIERLEAQA
ncbi:MAG TPA: isochorismatase family cysteine hydrolase [Candidatus Desulfaltia sp.]|nr:isochorismatase family cysteine hydrolase [Candidatus Desulfaltia sp.]